MLKPRRFAAVILGVAAATIALSAGIVHYRESHPSVRRPLTVIGFEAATPGGVATSAQIRAAIGLVPLPPPRPLHRSIHCRRFPNVTINVVLSDTRQFLYAPCQLPPAMRPVVDELKPPGGWPKG